MSESSNKKMITVTFIYCMPIIYQHGANQNRFTVTSVVSDFISFEKKKKA
jgi:hypothetical protein